MTRHLPTSTYRYQISPTFTLDDAAADLPRIAELGVDAVYLSPLLTSTTGSDHGYDWVDCSQVDPQRGGEEAWARFVPAARALGLKIVLDIVPNHCGISKPWENPAWWSLLREGQASSFAHWFDIDWTRGPVVVPVLPADGSLTALHFNADRSELLLHDLRLPVAPGTAEDGADAPTVAARQHYRLAPWTADATELNYRRFFAVSSLAGLRIEDPTVLEATHARIFRMVDEGQLDGLRIDHPDGLTDPEQYFVRLRERLGEDLWLVIEKIQAEGEQLPASWPVDGTSGYDAMADLTALMADRAGEEPMTCGYQELTGDPMDVAQHVLTAKQQMAEQLFGSERARIVRLLPSEVQPEADAALVALAVRLDVYRSYLPRDGAALEGALELTRRDCPELAATLDRLAPILGDADQEPARRFQQFTGALMAKGLEDTAWYRYSRWIGANEVGGHPQRFGLGIAEFHRLQQHRQQVAAHSMVATSTHDTKRGEDVRAALATLTELVDEAMLWGQAFQTATALPDKPFAWLLAQTLATGPLDATRLHPYATKAMREANTLTSWNDPDPLYESLVHSAIDRALQDPELSSALALLRDTVAVPAGINVLSQKTIALTMPGIPDVYRGTEFVEDSLVDPDNRRPVDLGRPMTALDLDKMHVVTTLLTLRREHPEWFTGYRPVTIDHPLREHLVGFDRGGAITLATRLPVGLARAGGWGAATLPLDGDWVDVLTGQECSGHAQIAALFARHPVAVLTRR